MQRTNYFIEGLQGAGKSTFVQRLSEHLNVSRNGTAKDRFSSVRFFRILLRIRYYIL